MLISLGDIDFNTNTPDSDGSIWLATTFTGWDSPPQQNGMLNYTSKDGAARQFATYGARALVIGGICKTNSEANFWKSWYRLTGTLAFLNTEATLEVVEGSTSKFLQVVRASDLNMNIDAGWFEFNIPLSAANPTKYDDATTQAFAASASHALNNVGNYLSEDLVITVTGAGTVILKNNLTGRTLTTGDAGVEVGTVFDLRERTAILSGVSVNDLLSPRSEWWNLYPGSNTVQNDGTAALTVDYKSAWI